ncbi:hypothetical protein MycrhDRAFT_2038 [Mycolicibacterium rhodesiae JS60]|nr:hypothetical protein MycrhDRAFT_2038 [Mycolicibacterium rhodesiae JS60]
MAGCTTIRLTDRGIADLGCRHGYQHPHIEEAVSRQRLICDTANGPSEHFVALAEKLVDVVEHADWAMFAKNGSDVTTLCLTIARAHTGRSVILVEEGTYHGALPWCNPDKTGVLPSDRAGLAYYTYNDLAGVEKLVHVDSVYSGRHRQCADRHRRSIQRSGQAVLLAGV